MADLRWLNAMMEAHDGKLDGLAECLRDPAFVLEQHQRDTLAEMMSPLKSDTVIRLAVTGGKEGRSANVVRDYELFCDVEGYKAASGIKKLPDAELKRIAEKYGLRETSSIRSAISNGRRYAEEYEALKT